LGQADYLLILKFDYFGLQMVTISEKMLTMRNWTVKFATISSFTGGKGTASERERERSAAF
jgi:hypothetical protein